MRFGPCMCGDTYCPSCGPAQGNYKCIGCGEWTSDFGEPDSKHDIEICRMIEEEHNKQMAEDSKLMDELEK